MTIAYLNVATDEQHLDIQREEIISFTSAKGMRVEEWSIEVCGEKVKHIGPVLKLILGRLKKGDVLIVSDISRLSLTLYELMEILTLCLEKEATVYCIKDGYIFDDQMDRRLMIRTFKMVDEIDHSLVSIRTKDALAQIKSTGKSLGRPKGSESKLFFLDTHKAEILQMLERGESVEAICLRFNVSKNTYYKYKNKLFFKS